MLVKGLVGPEVTIWVHHRLLVFKRGEYLLESGVEALLIGRDDPCLLKCHTLLLIRLLRRLLRHKVTTLGGSGRESVPVLLLIIVCVMIVVPIVRIVMFSLVIVFLSRII